MYARPAAQSSGIKRVWRRFPTRLLHSRQFPRTADARHGGNLGRMKNQGSLTKILAWNRLTNLEDLNSLKLMELREFFDSNETSNSARSFWRADSSIATLSSLQIATSMFDPKDRNMRQLIAAFGCFLIVPLAAKADTEWVPLFNGKDLTGWKIHDKPSGGIVEVDHRWRRTARSSATTAS